MDSSSKDYSVEDGIQQFFKASEFNGDNQMYCDTCDDKNYATTQYVIRNHPEVLMLLLKRFEFNYYYMKYFKIDRVVAVPYSLQIPEGQTYELYAIVDHFGDLMSGHYAATIKDEHGDRWFRFDDTRVTLFDYQPFQVDNTETSRSAYLLFYRKMKHADSCRLSHSGGVQPNPHRDDNDNDTTSVPIDRNVPEIVSVVPTVPPPGRSENVENPDSEVDVRRPEQGSYQDHDSYKNVEDEYVDKQGSDEGKKMKDDEENMEVNRQLICTETTSVEDQEKAAIQKNREESEEESLVEDQQQDNGELVSVNRNEHQDSKQRTGHYDVVEQSKGRRSQKINKDQVYRPSQTPHLPLSPERVTPGAGAGRLTPETRARSELASPASPVLSQLLGASRGDPPGRPPARTGDGPPTGTAAGEIREKGPARVQSRRQPPPTRTPPPARLPRGRRTPPREGGGPPRRGDARGAAGRRAPPREAGRAKPRFRRRGEGSDGATAPPAAARAQPRFAPQPDRPSP
ncbi:ubiquitin carboxyl-terminal hydrolase 19-like [Mugil cephalus]|uniref:ubiquitin carboxyl-terminal hydrolase 19-like n=1 Tax=Mugil cephalus TaxID=48193 RepID=UPI001FB5B5EB|nr:ubiquitin carboxyl-terminal hydrolase 19-like [Mugil cephalus]